LVGLESLKRERNEEGERRESDGCVDIEFDLLTHELDRALGLLKALTRFFRGCYRHQALSSQPRNSSL